MEDLNAGTPTTETTTTNNQAPAPAAPVSNAGTSVSNAGAATDGGAAAEGAGAPATPPPYTPNLKFKYFDPAQKKDVEKEFDDFIKGAIKDEKAEKAMRELYEKAHGLESVKHAREKFKDENETLKTEIRQRQKALNILSNYVQQDDFHSFFKALKIPEHKILQYAVERLQYREWTPEQKAAYDKSHEFKTRTEYLEDQNKELEQRHAQAEARSREFQLDHKLADPNIASAAASFDARMGRAGAFRNEVIRRGQYYWQSQHVDVPVEQAVAEVLQMIGGMQPAPTAMPAPQQPSGLSQTPEQSKPTITNVQGSGSSPAKQRPKSIADLRKLSAQMKTA